MDLSLFLSVRAPSAKRGEADTGQPMRLMRRQSPTRSRAVPVAVASAVAGAK
jgi:hypothetical protein